MDPGIPVPPTGYGGIERVVYLLSRQYAKMGHLVTLLAGPGSHCDGTTVHFGRNDLIRPSSEKYKEIAFVWKYLWSNRHTVDLIHNFGRLIYLLPILNFPVKKIMSYQRAVSARGVSVMNKLPNKNLVFTACSDYCASTGNVAGRWKTVYNAIDFDNYQLKTSVAINAPLMFLGRLDNIKGAHTAIAVAKLTGDQLLIAGNIPDTADNFQHFKSVIEPQFDGQQIIYVGEVNDDQKNTYLGLAKALLFPIEWDEPFGIVMIEANACGTPVIGFKRGSVSEVIQPGINGYVVDNSAEMASAVKRIAGLDRSACWSNAESRFNIAKIAEEYLSCFANDTE